LQERPDTDTAKKLEVCILREVRLDLALWGIRRDFACALQRRHSEPHGPCGDCRTHANVPFAARWAGFERAPIAWAARQKPASLEMTDRQGGRAIQAERFFAAGVMDA